MVSAVPNEMSNARAAGVEQSLVNDSVRPLTDRAIRHKVIVFGSSERSVFEA